MTPERAVEKAKKYVAKQISDIEKRLKKEQDNEPDYDGHEFDYDKVYAEWERKVESLNAELEHFREVERLLNEPKVETPTADKAAEGEAPAAPAEEGTASAPEGNTPETPAETPLLPEGWRGEEGEAPNPEWTTASQRSGLYLDGGDAYERAYAKAREEGRDVTYEDFDREYGAIVGEKFLETDKPYLQDYFRYFNDRASTKAGKATDPAKVKVSKGDDAALDGLKETAKELGLDVTFTTSDGEEHAGRKDEKDARDANGYVDIDASGNPKGIVINVDNCGNLEKAEKTLLHEGAAHWGLRVLFGDRFNDFLKGVYENATPDIREAIDRRMSMGEGMLEAVDEVIARIAERTDFSNVDKGFLSKITDLFNGMLEKLGFKTKITEDDLKQILKASYANLMKTAEERTGKTEEGAAEARQEELEEDENAILPRNGNEHLMLVPRYLNEDNGDIAYSPTLEGSDGTLERNIFHKGRLIAVQWTPGERSKNRAHRIVRLAFGKMPETNYDLYVPQKTGDTWEIGGRDVIDFDHGDIVRFHDEQEMMDFYLKNKQEIDRRNAEIQPEMVFGQQHEDGSVTYRGKDARLVSELMGRDIDGVGGDELTLPKDEADKALEKLISAGHRFGLYGNDYKPKYNGEKGEGEVETRMSITENMGGFVKEGSTHISKEDATAIINEMESHAETAPEIELTIENWDEQFGSDGRVRTPIGDVTMGDGQFLKLMRKGRDGKLGMIKPTLESPDVIIEDFSKAKDGDIAERDSSYVFVKAFRKSDGSRYYYFTSVTVSRDGMEVVVSNQEKSRNRVLRLMTEGKVLWRTPKDATVTSAEGQGLDYAQPLETETATKGSGITPQNTPSESKDTTNISTDQTISEKNNVEGENSGGNVVRRSMPDVDERQTTTPQFKHWFGDWENEPEEASKVVDREGKPLVVYHQTDSDFTVFDPRHPGAGTNDHHLPFGIFLKPTSADIGMRGKKQMPLFANIKNPLVMADRKSLTQYLKDNVEGYADLLSRYEQADKEYKDKYDAAFKESLERYKESWHRWKNGEITEDEYKNGIDDSAEDAILKEWRDTTNKLSAEMKSRVDSYFRGSDYDGIILEKDEGSFGRSTKTILAFDENQVKSATDNIGTFDPANPDIRYSRADVDDRFASEDERVERWPNGAVRSRGVYKNGKREGAFSEYNEDGTQTAYTEYRNGRATDWAVDWRDDGSVRMLSHFKDGKVDESYKFDEDGRVVEGMRTVDGEKQRVRRETVTERGVGERGSEWRYDYGRGDDMTEAERRAEEVIAELGEKGLQVEQSRTKGGATRYSTSKELDEKYPGWLEGQTRDDGRHQTQRMNTEKSYRHIGNWLSENGMEGVSILDASSGLGLGTKALREMGFDVDDVEPYPSENRERPTFLSYDDIDKKYDVVISNAVLNVIPDDWRRDVLHSMADKVKDGGRMIINVRDAGSIAAQKQKIELDSPSEILVTDKKGNITAYQKGFTPGELRDYVSSELGDGWDVTVANAKNSGLGSGAVAVVAYKNGGDLHDWNALDAANANTERRRAEEARTVDKDSEELFKAAKERFGTTSDMREAGYILPDGSMLDFSGRHEMAKGSDTSFLRGQRHADHRQISDIAYDFDENETGVETNMTDFIERGAIRIDDNAGFVNLDNKPTAEQKRMIRRLVARKDGDVTIEFGNGDRSDHYIDYDGARPERVLADIDRYYDEGVKSQGNVRYSKEDGRVQGLENYSERELLDIVRDDVERKLSDAGIDGVRVKDMALNGSRLRGDARGDSDLDVVVEYDGRMSEDGMFNLLNEEPLEIDGVRVDINPITKGKSGSLEDYMRRSRAYDESILNGSKVRYSKEDEDSKKILDKDVANVIADSVKDGLPQTRKDALSMLDEMKQPFHNEDTGYEIYVSHGDAKHTMSYRNIDQIKVIGVIDKVINNAVKIGEMPLADDEPENTKAVHLFYCPVNIDGKQYSGRMVVKEYDKGNFVVDQMDLYNTQLREEKRTGETPNRQQVPPAVLSPVQSNNMADAQSLSSEGLQAHPSTVRSEYKVKDLIHSTQEFDKKLLGLDENSNTLFSRPDNDIDLSNWNPLEYDEGVKPQDSGVRYSRFGGNSGYVGYSMSKRAERARNEGRYPKTDFKREYGVGEKPFNVLSEIDIIESGEWHHTSMYGNRTKFYHWEEDWMPYAYTEKKKEIDKLCSDYRKLKSEKSNLAGDWNDIYPERQRLDSEIKSVEDQIRELLENSNAKKEYDESEQREREEAERKIAEIKRIAELRSQYEKEVLDKEPVPDRLDMGDGWVIETDGSRSPGYWRYFLNGNEWKYFSNRNKHIERDLDNRAKEMVKPSVSFEDWARDRGEVVRYSRPDNDTDLSQWNPLEYARQNVERAREARNVANEAWRTHREGREQAIHDMGAIRSDDSIPKQCEQGFLEQDYRLV